MRSGVIGRSSTAARDSRRVVATGMGVVSPVGCSLDEFWRSLIDGRCGISRITRFDPSPYPCRVAGEIRDFPADRFFDEKQRNRLALRTQYGVAAALMCLDDANWQNTDGELGVIAGTTSSGFDALEEAFLLLHEHGYQGTRAFPHALLKGVPSSLGAETSGWTGFRSKVTTVSTACTSGLLAVQQGVASILAGECDAVLCLAADAEIFEYVFAYYCRGKMLPGNGFPPDKISRPYDARRSGGVLSEGGGCILLENAALAKRRGAEIAAEIAGVGTSGQGFSESADTHIPQGMASAMLEALAMANTAPSMIDYIGGNGVSDPALDHWEIQGIKSAFGDDAYRIPISSIKALTGVPQAAGGVLQLIATVLAMNRGLLPPTMNYEYPDSDCDLDVIPNVARRNTIRRALVLAHGINGNDAAIALKTPRCP